MKEFIIGDFCWLERIRHTEARFGHGHARDLEGLEIVIKIYSQRPHPHPLKLINSD